MKIIAQSRPCLGGPLDGCLTFGGWSRLWIVLEREGLRPPAPPDLAPPEEGEVAPVVGFATVLRSDSDLGYTGLELVLNTLHTPDEAVGELEGVYVHHAKADEWRWLQLRASAPPAPRTPRARYLALAEFCIREKALEQRIFEQIGQPGDALGGRILTLFPRDSDLQYRASTFAAVSRRVLGRPELWNRRPPTPPPPAPPKQQPPPGAPPSGA